MYALSDSPAISRNLAKTARVMTAAGGLVSEHLVVREVSGSFSCAVREKLRNPSLLVSYSRELVIPLGGIRWRTDSSLDVEARPRTFTTTQNELLDLWLALVTETNKLTSISRVVPSIAVTSPSVRSHLAQGGYPDLRHEPKKSDARDTLIGWHSIVGRQQQAAALASDVPAVRRCRLIPLKHFINHHPDGAPQVPQPGRIAVATSSISNEQETFENYGDLDALHLLMRFGYIDSTARVVHSLPVKVESPHLGLVAIGRTPPRYPTQAMAWNALPPIIRTPDGLRLNYLSARPNGRSTTVQLLAMVHQSAAGMSSALASGEAERLLDEVLEANQRYYLRLDELLDQADAASRAAGVGPPQVHDALRQVSALQRQRLAAMWSG